MEETFPLVITISRELGSGGAYIGHQLAKKLNMYYADHEIIAKTAENLSVLIDDVAPREEKIKSFWQSFFLHTGVPEFYYPAIGSYSPTSVEIFNTQSDVIKQIVKERAAVIIGRCGYYILRDYPNLVSVFLHADVDIRAKRLQDVRKISEETALAQIAESDKERALYINRFTNQKWTDVRNFNLAIDTGKIGLDNATELILSYINARSK